jgi:hypothetical protein
VAVTGFRLYQIDFNGVTTLAFDGANLPAVLAATVTNLVIN